MNPTWKKPALDCDCTNGCLCCPSRPRVLPLDFPVIVYGTGELTCNGVTRWDINTEESNAEATQREPVYLTVANAEAMAVKDPDNDWRIEMRAPLWEGVWQRHGPNEWVLIEKGMGFA